MRRPALLALLLFSASGAAEEQAFLALDDGQRYWFFEGAFRTVSHLIALSDKAKGDCAANFYLQDREAKRKLIEDTIKSNPDLGETTIILSLITKACGPLAPKR